MIYICKERMSKKILFAIIVSFFVISFLNSEVITLEEQTVFRQMLKKQNISENSMNFLKDWASDTEFKLPVIVKILNNPLYFAQFTKEVEIKSQQNPKKILDFYSKVLFQCEVDISDKKLIYENYFKNHKPISQNIFDFVEMLFRDAGMTYKQAWDSLSVEDFDKIKYFSYSLWSEPEDSLKYNKFFENNKITDYEELDIEKEIVPVLKKIKFDKIMQAAKIFVAGYEVLKNNLNQLQLKNLAKVERETEYGKFCIGSPFDDTYYDFDYTFLLEPGGNDVYNFNRGSVFGKDNFLLLDLSGDDLYRSKQISGLFGAVGGMSINFDAKGNDIYIGDDISFATLFGYHLSYDAKGDDYYRTGLYSLGAGTFGISSLIDSCGNDTYFTTESGEGFGGTLGAGLLLDYNGSDNYLAGGKYFHAPLAPHDYRTLAQGFGFGVRPYLGGGIGVLHDIKGNDSFRGGVYAQGVGYWYALGILINGSGNDFYDAVYYPQGSGIHLAGGFLLDREGEDHYYSKHGPGQGAAHDYGVGFLVDRSGDDRYSVEGGNGLGLTNSVGVFLDVKGNDLYQSPSSQYGNGRAARHSGSLGLFLDTGGRDVYPHERCKNDTIWSYGEFGIGFDTLMVVEEKTTIEEESEEREKEVDSLATTKELFDIASEWAVGNNKKRVDRAREILLNREAETAKFIYEKRLDTKSGLVFRAIENFIENSDAYQPYIWKGLDHEDSLCVKNTMAIIGMTEDTTYIDTLHSFVKRKKYLKSALSNLGDLKSDKSTEILKNFINHPSEKLRVITARSLLKIDTKKSREYLKKMKADDSFLVRSLVRLKFEEENTDNP